MAEEGNNLRNVSLNRFSKLVYEYYINNVQVRKFNKLPCPERFDNVRAAALRTFNSATEKRAMILGMTCANDSRNSATGTSIMVGSGILITYDVLRISIMYLQLPHKWTSFARILGGISFAEWKA